MFENPKEDETVEVKVKSKTITIGTSFSTSDWEDKISYNVPRKLKGGEPIPLYYGHLSVSPKEVATANMLNWQSGSAYLDIRNRKNGKSINGLFLDEGKQIFETVRRHPLFHDIMDALRESEKKNGKLKVFLTFLQYEIWENKNTQSKIKRKIQTIGPKMAMKRIFFFDHEKPTNEKPIRTAAGNMHIQCKRKTKGYRPFFRRELSASVQAAYDKQTNIFECFQNNKNNLFPYLKNIFVVDWYSTLEIHLYRLYCSGYVDENDQPLEMYTMYGSKLEEKMKEMVSYVDKKIPLVMNKDWWTTWIKEYKKELEDNENTKERKKHKSIRNSMIHKKYKSLRQKQRIRPPTKWMIENQLLPCP